jgi:hypothetical protein
MGVNSSEDKPLNHAIDLVISAILLLCALVLEAIGFVDGLLATAMTRIGIPGNAQIALLIGISIILIVLAIRSLGTVLSSLIIVLLVLLLLHKAMPGMHVPVDSLPAAPPPNLVHA